MSGLEGIGEAVTGGMAARAVEPDSGNQQGEAQSRQCPNCGAEVRRHYCEECGQKAHLHRTVGAFWHDLVHGVFHFEGKIWRTLPMLVWRPGELTRRYIEGERARFVSPTAMFLFTVFLMFAVFSSIGGPIPPQAAEQVEAQRAENIRLLRERIAGNEARRASMAATGQPTEALDAQIAEQREQLSWREQVSREGMVKASAQRIAENMSPGFFRGAVEKFAKDPALTIYKLQNNAYKFSWLMIPLCVPMVWLLFLWRRQHWQLYDHTVFVTYSLTFQSLTLIIYAVLVRFGAPFLPLTAALGLITGLHIQRQLREAYNLGWFSTFWRMNVLSILMTAALVLFALTLIAIGATG